MNRRIARLLGLTGLALVCPAIAQAQGLTSPFQTPPGSWSQSCMGGMVMSGELIANCRDSRGFYRQGRITVASCRGSDIVNDNGNLVCAPQPERRRDWARPGRSPQRVTVYEHTNYQGVARTYDSAVPNLVPLQFNDVISSMQVTGPWEVCTDVDFRGRCEIFDQDVASFVPLGLNDVISSMRPVRW